MARDAFDAALAGFRRWAKATERKLSDDPRVVADELETLLDLMRDYLGIDRPAELSRDGLEELLLRVYPREVRLWEPSDAEITIPALRDFLAYLAESGEITPDAARALDRELDRIAPRFTDALMDASLEPWDEGEDEEDISLKEALGLPDRLPPMRLPVEAELAATARGVPTASQLGQLVAWLGAGRAVTENAELAGGDTAAAAAALGLGPADAASRLRDLPRLDYLWQLALEAGFTELDEDETHAVPGETARVFSDGDDDSVLETWKTLFGLVIETTLEIAASRDLHRSRELEFFGHGTMLGVMLFLTRPDGVRVAEASQMIMNASTEGLPPASAAQAWQSWVRAHGDPVRMLLDQMAELGAVRVADGDDGELAWLTPLGLAAVRDLLAESGVEIPLLPPSDQMTAADLIAVASGLGEEEFDAETRGWLACRTPESAAKDLLSVAAEADPVPRMIAVSVVSRLGAAAEPALRDALGRPELRGYAKLSLAALAAGDPAAGTPGSVELAPDERAWILLDSFVMGGWGDVDDEGGHDPAALAEQLRAAVPAGEEPALFEAMARVPHPDAAGILTVIGKYHPDKKVAKAARTAAYKAASRQAAQRR